MEAPYAPVLPCRTVKQQRVSGSAVMQHPCSSRAHACCAEGGDERSSPPSPAASHNTTTPSTTKRRRHNASPTTPCTALGAGGGGRPPTLKTTTARMKTAGVREAATRPPPSVYSNRHPVALPLMAALISLLLMPYADAASVVGRRPPTDTLLTAEQRRELLVVWASGRKTQDSDVYAAPVLEDVSSLQQEDAMTMPEKTSHSNFDIRTFAVPDVIVDVLAEQPGDFAAALTTPTTPQRLLFEPLPPTESIDRFVADVEGSGGDVVGGLSVVDVRARIAPERNAALALYNYTWHQVDGDEDELDATASTLASERQPGATTTVPPPALFSPRAASTVLPQPLLNTDDDGDEAGLVKEGVRHAAVYYDESSNSLHDQDEQPVEEDTDVGVTYLLLQNASSPHPNSIYSTEYNSTNDNDNNRLRQPRATTESQRQRSAQGDAFGVSWNETDYGVEGDSAINNDAYESDSDDAQEDNRLRDRSIPYDDRQAQLDNSLGDDRGRQPSPHVVVPLFSSQTTSSPNAVLLEPMGSEQKNEERMQDDEDAVAGANRPNSTQLPTATTSTVVAQTTPTLFEDQAQRDAEEITPDDLQNRWRLPHNSPILAKTRANGGAHVREPHSEQNAGSNTGAVNSVRQLPTVSAIPPPTTTLPYQFEFERTTQLAGADNWSGQTDEIHPWTWPEDFDETSPTSGTLFSGQSSAQGYADEQQTAPKERSTTANILNVDTPSTTPGASSKPAETWQNRWRLTPGQRARLRRRLRKLRSAVQTYNDYLRTWCVDEATGSRFVARHRMCRHWQNAKIELYEQKIRLIYGDDTGDWPERQQTWFAGRRRDDRFYTYFF